MGRASYVMYRARGMKILVSPKCCSALAASKFLIRAQVHVCGKER